ncbi:MAG: endoglucanase [Puniceicoccaceae bacterium 5H]|nr:MAG: endoglucanase [Puniceicoccaceae bacterium 5H]
MPLPKTLLSLGLCAALSAAHATESTSLIRLNQVGYPEDGEKIASVVGGGFETFRVIDLDTGESVLEGKLTSAVDWPLSGETLQQADFSKLDDAGHYRLLVDDLGLSHDFDVGGKERRDLLISTIRGFYLHRVSTALEPEYAGKFARPLGHPDMDVVVHKSAATEARPAGSTYAAPKGWYDAGDYNKYVVNSGITCYTMMLAYELYGDYLDEVPLNIPESGNTVPDLLDEIRWNLDWMLNMQEPESGAVYHKLTHLNFQGFVMPQEVTAKRYFVGKSTSAAYCFAATMARASVVYQDFDPAYAHQCLEAAQKAFAWANKREDVPFKNPSDVVTGEYGYSEGARDWAAAELAEVTGEALYRDVLAESSHDAYGKPSWADSRALVFWSQLVHEKDKAARKMVVSEADRLLQIAEDNPYGVPMLEEDFIWGSNGELANRGVTLLLAYKATGKDAYYHAAEQCLDYILGRNALGYSFLMGWGDLQVEHPHHRISSADGIDQPYPGWVVGGPNAIAADQEPAGGIYFGHLPANTYIDGKASYATNEVALNWNAPLVFLLSGLAAEEE